MASWDDTNFSILKGKTLVSVENPNDEVIYFETAEGEEYRLWHQQDCCESVTIEDINGDLEDLVGHPILLAEEVTHENENPKDITPPEYQDSFTWTFYKLSTIKGSVTIRWYGESNGYYSEAVSFGEVASLL